mgnify:CR=1 FL=1
MQDDTGLEGEERTTVDAWLESLGDPPCGEDLEWDNEFLEMTQASVGKPGSQFKDDADAKPPDWRSVKRLAEGLFERTRDVRVAIFWARAQVHLEGARTLPASLRLVHGLLERYWDELHPRLDDGDAYARVNALPVTEPYYRDVGLAAGLYSYRITAVDGTGNVSAASPEVSGTATVGGVLTGLNGTLAYDKGSSVIGVRALAGGVAGTESTLAGAFPNYSTNGQRLYYRSTAAGLGAGLGCSRGPRQRRRRAPGAHREDGGARGEARPRLPH